jgi:glutathione S-transferase
MSEPDRSSSELVLYGEATWQSPWVFHAMVALEELGVAYRLVTLPLPIPSEQRREIEGRAVIGKVPVLVDGALWLSESLAISEYLAERFGPPAHPRLLPAVAIDRARARQLMSMLRTSLSALREDRPTTSVFGKPVARPLSEGGKRDAAELVRVADRLVRGEFLFDAWCIADADLALALMRLVANGDPVPPRIADYARAQWQRASVRRYLASAAPSTG